MKTYYIFWRGLIVGKVKANTADRALEKYGFLFGIENILDSREYGAYRK